MYVKDPYLCPIGRTRVSERVVYRMILVGIVSRLIVKDDTGPVALLPYQLQVFDEQGIA